MSDNDKQQFPNNWLIASDYEPKKHMMNLKGKDYLNVQNRLLWFIRDQRDFIVRGLATTSYIVRTELVEQDLERGFAHFKTYVRDVLGNEATMYGSETAKDFGDYAEKASTKSLGRALWALGYGTGMAPEMDESDDRPVDSPIERKREQPAPQMTEQQRQQQRLARQNDAELAEQAWPYLQDVEFRSAMNKRNIRTVEDVNAFVATAAGKPISAVTYADRDICIKTASSRDGLAGAR